jgi:putative ABC transport system permease protein
VRRFFPTQWSYIWRQSIANLYRPNNQTVILVVTIGLGAALISTLFLVQDLLLKQVAYTGAGNVPNMIVFDIQTPQKEAVAKLTADNGLPVRQIVPIVTMRIESVDGIPKSVVEAEFAKRDTLPKEERRRRRRGDDDGPREENPADTLPHRWIYEREFRSTYRDSLIETEELVEGDWHGSVGDDGVIYVSVQEGVARDMKAKVGSKVVFNVQGAMIETVVGSIRKVNFNRIQTNFFIVFPKGVLEKAPQFFVILSRVEDEATSAKYQQALVSEFPNVSVIDLTQILKSVRSVLDKVSFVIRFMAFFSILTGMVVLISSVVLSKYQRIQESVLLRTLGAHRRQILRINALEYLLLGSLATLTGIALSIAGSFVLAKWQFNVPFSPDLMPSLYVFLGITGLTMLIGMFNNREVVSKPPLEVLRKEV